jgi:hypothetical protein
MVLARSQTKHDEESDDEPNKEPEDKWGDYQPTFCTGLPLRWPLVINS